MLILKNTENFDKKLCPAVALGTFDGVHRGHQKVLNGAVDSGYYPVALVINRPLDKKNRSPMLVTPEQKNRLFETLGIKCLVDYEFEKICFLSPEVFVKEILKNQKSLENQLSEVGKFQKERGLSPEFISMFNRLLDYYAKYQNNYVKHNDAVKYSEIDFVINLTTLFMKSFM